jgi:hypothetical protein
MNWFELKTFFFQKVQHVFELIQHFISTGLPTQNIFINYAKSLISLKGTQKIQQNMGFGVELGCAVAQNSKSPRAHQCRRTPVRAINAKRSASICICRS